MYPRRVNYAQLLFPDFALILCGYLVCRFTALNRSVWQQVDSLVYFLLFPAMLFYSIVRTPLNLSAVSSLAGAGLGLAVVGVGTSYALPYLPWLGRHIDRHEHAAAAQVGFRFNSFIGLALVERIVGPQGPQLMAVLIGMCVPLFNLAAVWPMAHRAGRGLVGELARNPLVLATLAALAVNLAGGHIPQWIEPSLSRLGGASIVMGLLAAGAGMQATHLANAKALAGGVLLLKHLGLPLTAWALCALFNLDTTQATVLMTFSALPTAASCYVLAARMGFNGAYVAGLVTLSTLLAMLSLPLALALIAHHPH